MTTTAKKLLKTLMRAAIISSPGIGDGLMMLTAAYNLAQAGYLTTLFHDPLCELNQWFPYCQFFSQAGLFADKSQLLHYDLVLVQYDNRPVTRKLAMWARNDALLRVIIYYPAYDPKRHLPLGREDVIFDPSKTIIDNLADSLKNTLPTTPITKSNGIVIPSWAASRSYSFVAIHPTSTVLERTWAKKKFLAVARALAKKKIHVAFCMHPKERPLWVEVERPFIQVPLFSTLSDLAAFLVRAQLVIGNESGIGHLASNLGVRTLIIAGCHKRIAMWRPGWALGDVMTPPKWVLNSKKCRLRTKKWQWFISPRAVVAQALTRLELGRFRGQESL